MCNERDDKKIWNPAIARLWRVAGLPALIYVGVAVGLPAMNGASLKYGAAFWKHALATCVTLLALVAALMTLELFWDWARLKYVRVKTRTLKGKS